MDEKIRWNFGRLEAELADAHSIDPSKRTAFASRLKNFHRLGFPWGFETQKGRAALYGPGEAAMMALAVEMTQLGLAPERVVSVLSLNMYPTMMALHMASSWLVADPEGYKYGEEGVEDFPSMFLYFDPSALDYLTLNVDHALVPDLDEASNTFFYGGRGIVLESLLRWTSEKPRISLINVTTLLDQLTRPMSSTQEKDIDEAAIVRWRTRFFTEVQQYSGSFAHDNLNESLNDESRLRFLKSWMEMALPPTLPDGDSVKKWLNFTEDHLGIDREFIASALLTHWDIEEPADVGPEA